MDRQTFVKARCVGSASLFLDGIDPETFGDVTLPEPPPIEVVHGPKPAKSALGMPGLFPGRVVEVTDSGSIARNRVSQPVVRDMIERGMKELTGERSASAAWNDAALISNARRQGYRVYAEVQAAKAADIGQSLAKSCESLTPTQRGAFTEFVVPSLRIEGRVHPANRKPTDHKAEVK